MSQLSNYAGNVLLGKCDFPQRALNCFKNSSYTSQIATYPPFNKKENIFSCLIGDNDINSLHGVLFCWLETVKHSHSFKGLSEIYQLRSSCCAFPWFARIMLFSEESECDHMRRQEAETRQISLIRWADVCVSAICMWVVSSGCWTCGNRHVATNMSVWFRAPLWTAFEQLGMKADQVLLHQECGVEQGNEFQEAEHANKFIIPAWFRSNYHFASKAIQDWVALVKFSQVWIQINICSSANAQGEPRWQPEIGVAMLDFFHTLSGGGLLISTHIQELKSSRHVSDGPIASKFMDLTMRTSLRGLTWTCNTLPFMLVCCLAPNLPSYRSFSYFCMRLIWHDPNKQHA